MTSGKHILRTYLQALKEARQAGADDYKAAEIAEKETMRKHGKLPEEGKNK